MENVAYNTILTDDIDSLLGCAIEKHLHGNTISQFYDFKAIYESQTDHELLGIDLALHKGKSWCNHVVRIKKDDYVNPETANPNAVCMVARHNYTKKYAGSTALLMWSYYGLPLPKTDEGKILLLSIDSAHKGHYSDFREIHNKWLKALGFEELIDLLNRKTKFDFEMVQSKYKLSSKIRLDENGRLVTRLPLNEISELLKLNIELPDEQFKLKQQLIRGKADYGRPYMSKNQVKDLFSFALTYKNTMNYTTIKGGTEQ
ncbi:hypothetical protein [Domibacillus antri]|nr:hypothetical protein [Domibacillus antri]